MIYVYYKSYFKGGKIMNKKKLGTGLLALALVGVVGIGGSLAWFTDTENTTNTFTVNHVDIGLKEDNWAGQNKVFMPGDTIPKDPVVTLDDESSPAYVRIKGVKLVVTPADGRNPEQLEYDIDEIADINGDWVKGTDGNYYYQYALSNDEGGLTETTPLFNSITLPGAEWDNDYVGATINIEIVADAIQSKNYEPTRNEKEEIVAWDNAGEIQSYTLSEGN